MKRLEKEKKNNTNIGHLARKKANLSFRNREKIIRATRNDGAFRSSEGKKGASEDNRNWKDGFGRNAREQIFWKEEKARLEERSRGHDLEQFLLSKRRGKRIRPGTKGRGGRTEEALGG